MNRSATIRRAISVPEVLAAAAIVGVLIAFVAQLLISTATHQQAAERRTLAMHELSNVAERIAMLSYEETTRERLKAIELSPSLTAALPDASLAFDVDNQADDELPAKRVTISVTWEIRDDAPSQPLKLVVWKHQHREASP